MIGWIIVLIFLLFLGIVSYILWRKYGKDDSNISEEDEEYLDKMNGNDDILIDFTSPRGHTVYEVPRSFDGRDLGGISNIHAFPRDIIINAEGNPAQDPKKGIKILVPKGRLFTMADNTRSPRNIHLALPERVEDLPNNPLGELFRPVLAMIDARDSVLNALIKEGKKKDELIEMVGTGKIKDMVMKEVAALNKNFNIDSLARQGIEESV